jgi:hypothetical protein
VTLTIKTVGAIAKLNDSPHSWPASTTFVLAGLILPLGMRKRFKVSRAAQCLLFLAFALHGAGCGAGSTSNSNGGAAVGSFTVHVTASSAGGSASKPVILTMTIVK